MYYINPWVFYIINFVVHIQITCVCVTLIGGIIWLIAFFAGPVIIDEVTKTQEQEESYLKVFWKWMKKFPLIFLICSGLLLVIPGEETMYKMIASKISTSDVEHVMEKIDEVVDSIIDSKEQADDTGN